MKNSHRPIRSLPLVSVMTLFIVSMTFETVVDGPSLAPAVSAAGLGNPYVNYVNGYWLPAESASLDAAILRNALVSGSGRPTALTTGDFDEDGVPDLVTAYAIRSGGMVGIQTGNLDALYPYSKRVVEKREDGTLVEEPFFERLSLLPLGTTPEFLEAGDFDADGHLDLLAASSRDDALIWLPGLGDGSFGRERRLQLPGVVSAVATGDVNRRDGLADVAVGFDGDNPGLLVFEHPAGAFGGEPERFEFAEAPSSIVIGQLDADVPFDLALGSGRNLILVKGRNRWLSASSGRQAATPGSSMTVQPVGSPIVAIEAGRFTGDPVADLAFVTKEGDFVIRDGGSGALLTTPYTYTYTYGGVHPIIRASKVSSLQRQDVVILDRERDEVSILHAEHLAFARSMPGDYPESTPLETGHPEPISFRIDGEAVALRTMRLNGDGLEDLAILTTRNGQKAPQALGALENVAIVPTAPLNTYTVDTDAYGFGDRTPGDGVCETHNGGCTYGAAVDEANASAGPDMILFALSEFQAQAWTSSEHIQETVTVDGTSRGRVVGVGDGGISAIPPATGVVIRGFALNGYVQINGDDSEGTDNLVEDVWVGLNGAGDGPATDLNLTRSLEIFSGFNTVGGSTTSARNVTQAMNVRGSGNVVLGNFVGLNVAGTEPIERVGPMVISPNSQLGPPVTDVQFGGPGPNDGNVVGDAYTLLRNTVGTIIQGNIFGADATGTRVTDRNDTFATLDIQNSPETTIGGASAGAGNLLVGIGDVGLRLSVAPQSVVQGNYIGTDITGSDALGNETSGLHIRLSEGSLIGGTGSGAGNLISGNNASGMFLAGDGADVEILGNRIGTDHSTGRALGNAEAGILVDGIGWTIGGSDPEAGNIIAGNVGHGIHVDNTDTKVIGNYIGTNRTGLDLGNGGHGVFVDLPGRRSLIGGEAPGEGNTIAYNVGDGIFVEMNMREVATWKGNSIFDNGELGIDLHNRNDIDAGLTENDPDDRDGSGPNNYQNFPELAKSSEGVVSITLDTDPNVTYRVELFGSPSCDPSGNGEGKYFLSSYEISTGDDGTGSISQELTVIEGRQWITAVAIDPDGRASEFSVCLEADVTPTPMVRVMEDSLGRDPGPVPNTAVRLGRFDPSDPVDPISFEADLVTDANGMITLPLSFQQGDEFFIQAQPFSKPAVKAGHDAVDNVMYRVYSDNIHIDNQGRMETAELDPDLSMTTPAYLEHTSVGYNLVVSIEWEASAAYVDGLIAALRSANNHLYDVSNGEAFWQKVAIYDRKQQWDHADVLFHASNMVRPYAGKLGITYGADTRNANMNFPPIWDGSEERTIDRLLNDVGGNFYNNWASIVHEFGHYAWGFGEEYVNQHGNSVYPNGIWNPLDANFQPKIYFGFMDTIYERRQKAVSEMSAFSYPPYLETEHASISGGLPTAESFRKLMKDELAGNTGAVYIEFHTPGLRGMGLDDWVVGPNDPDITYSVGDMMEIVDLTSRHSRERFHYVVKDEGGNVVPSADVVLEKAAGVSLPQGKTNSAGEIRLLGAVAGDEVRYSADSRTSPWTFSEVKVGEAGKNSDGGQDPIEVVLKPIAGNITLLPSARVESGGQLAFSIQSSLPLPENPMLTFEFDGESRVFELTPSPGEPDYTYGFSEPAPFADDRMPDLQMPDSLGELFFVPQTIEVADASAGGVIRSEGGRVALVLDESDQQADLLTLLATPYPTPTGGLPSNLTRVSDVVSVQSAPEASAFSGQLHIGFHGGVLQASVNEAVGIYRWDDGWQLLETAVSRDTSFQVASTPVTEPGLFAVFLDLDRTTTTDVTSDELPDESTVRLRTGRNYPNPFSDITVVPIELTEPVMVGATVFNVLGQRVGGTDARELPAGRHEIVLEASGLAPGPYVYVIDAGGERVKGVMLVAR